MGGAGTYSIAGSSAKSDLTTSIFADDNQRGILRAGKVDRLLDEFAAG